MFLCYLHPLSEPKQRERLTLSPGASRWVRHHPASRMAALAEAGMLGCGWEWGQPTGQLALPPLPLTAALFMFSKS